MQQKDNFLACWDFHVSGAKNTTDCFVIRHIYTIENLSVDISMEEIRTGVMQESQFESRNKVELSE